ncbi:DUF4307 domain-containing protein [Actinacidiphila sp. bgisy167]|uniref:DUF4307 domain-containing protein n=1 Tax=Actinacidiphila sp. bgisy167 TaxID=3413797 RepID=UPI003D7159C1
MSAVRDGLPEGRYGRGADADARTDRRLRLVGAVLGVVLLLFVGWIGWDKLAGTEVSAEVIKFQVVSDQEVQVHLEVRKDAGVTAVCTLRSLAEDHGEVGRKDVRLAQDSSRVDTVVAIRTTGRGTSAELVGCVPAA